MDSDCTMSSVEWHKLYNKERLRANAAEEKLKANGSNFGNLSEETTEVIEGLRDWNNDPKLLSQAGESQLAVLELADALDNWKTEAEENADLVVSLEAELAALRKKAEADRDEERAAHDAVASICHEAGVDGGDGTSISLVRVLVADLAAARAELGALGPVEYIRETNEHPRIRTYIQCIKDDIDALAIRVVKEATEAAELQAMQDAIKARVEGGGNA